MTKTWSRGTSLLTSFGQPTLSRFQAQQPFSRTASTPLFVKRRAKLAPATGVSNLDDVLQELVLLVSFDLVPGLTVESGYPRRRSCYSAHHSGLSSEAASRGSSLPARKLSRLRSSRTPAGRGSHPATSPYSSRTTKAFWDNPPTLLIMDAKPWMLVVKSTAVA